MRIAIINYFISFVSSIKTLCHGEILADLECFVIGFVCESCLIFQVFVLGFIYTVFEFIQSFRKLTRVLVHFFKWSVICYYNDSDLSASDGA